MRIDALSAGMRVGFSVGSYREQHTPGARGFANVPGLGNAAPRRAGRADVEPTRSPAAGWSGAYVGDRRRPHSGSGP